MKRYNIYVMPEAGWDIQKTYQHIAFELMMPITARNYRDGIFYTIEELRTTAGIYAFTQNEFIQSQYGSETRTVRYKKMTIIYNVIGDKVFIRRVIAGSLIR